MNGRFERIVRQSLQKVPNVHNQCSLYGSGIEPFVIGREYLQATGHILPQQGDTLDIGVRTDTDVYSFILVAVGGVDIRCTGVVDINPICPRVGDDTIKMIPRKIQGKGKEPDHLPREFEAFLPEFDGDFTEALEMAGSFPDDVWLSVRIIRVPGKEKTLRIRDGRVIDGVISD